MNFQTRAISFLLAAFLIPTLILVIYKEPRYFLWWSLPVLTLWLGYELINKGIIKRRNK